MDISIVIVNFNTKDLVLQCIKSIEESKPKSKYEIIIIDNNSDEPVKTKKAIVVENKENLGFAKANNQGIKLAKSKYVLLLNSDTIVKDNAIDELVKFAKSKKDVGVVAPRLLNTDGSIQASVFRLPTIWRAIKQYFLGHPKLLDKYFIGDSEPTVVESAVMAAFLITPAVLKKVGLLDEKYFMYFEDLDYCRRVEYSGLKIYYLPMAEIVHIHGASGGMNNQLIESAKKYHGSLGYYVFTFILWLGQKSGL